MALQLLAYTVAGPQGYAHDKLHERSLLDNGSSSYDGTATYTTFYGEPTCMFNIAVLVENCTLRKKAYG